jgi:hypothetical protein
MNCSPNSRGGDSNVARREVERVAALVGENRRYRLPLLRSQAVLAQWDGHVAQAIAHLEAALDLAQEMELPGEAWPILGELGRLYAERGDPAFGTQLSGVVLPTGTTSLHHLAYNSMCHRMACGSRSRRAITALGRNRVLGNPSG